MVIPKINSEKARDACKSVDWEAKSQHVLRINDVICQSLHMENEISKWLMSWES